MGFFKKIGNSIKKNVSFKNVLKLATPLMGAIPIVGGLVQTTSQKLQDNHEAKLANKQAQAEYDSQQALALASQSASAVANAGSQIFAKSVIQGVNDGMSAGFVEGTGQIGSTVVTSTLKVWFQKNWKIVAGAFVAFFALVYLMRSGSNSGGGRKRR